MGRKIKWYEEPRRIVAKAIDIAVKNGYVIGELPVELYMHVYARPINGEHLKTWREQAAYGLIFDKEFAKAFFGNDVCSVDMTKVPAELTITEIGELLEKKGAKALIELDVPFEYVQNGYQYHLRQMVVSDSPIDYIARFINPKLNNDDKSKISQTRRLNKQRERSENSGSNNIEEGK